MINKPSVSRSTKIDNPWKTIHKDMTKNGLKQSFNSNLHYYLAKDRFTQTVNDDFLALAITVRDRIVERWISTQQNYHKTNSKRVYYLSMEFLIGRLLGNNLINLDLLEKAEAAMSEMGLDIEQIRGQETDAGLGNGGLGRLAACFLDSMATLGIPAHGYGIRYDYGIFNQKIVNGHQVETPEEWLKAGNPWEFARPEYAQPIQFYGEARKTHGPDGKTRWEWVNTQNVIAMPYDMPVPGYKNDIVNTLRLWSARASEEFDLEDFNTGDYEKAVYGKIFSENISKVLYPNDANSQGKELRLKQEYFFTSASIADIIRRFKSENSDIRKFHEQTQIQLNDTHPALAIAELMRVLVDKENLDWETAWRITVNTFAYTNHTVMPEALECWSVALMEKLLPRHMQIIYDINDRFLKEISRHFHGDAAKISRLSLIHEGESKQVRMANLAVIGSHSVNGVSALHSTLIQQTLFKDFFELYPDRFNNKTNGVTHRRWLLKANPRLSHLVTESIGDKWIRDLSQIKKLEKFASDKGFRQSWREAKAENKRFFSNYVGQALGIKLNPESIFDVQVKRIHEYKRQLLFAFHIIAEYLKCKHEPSSILYPRTYFFGGKAAPGYAMAKLIIKFINNTAALINADTSIRDRIKVVFLENYRVSLAEKIFPASDVSEQISTAGTEASGTGCMKFMMNGALTVGTLDGANIEILEEVGKENIFIFGLKEQEVRSLKENGYRPKDYLAHSPQLKEIFERIRNNFFSPKEHGIFEPLVDNLLNHDPYLVLADFDAYRTVQDEVTRQYLDSEDWARKSILNTARSGKFSSDRTIREYASQIWKVPHA